jgi:serine/threonine-protein kinase
MPVQVLCPNSKCQKALSVGDDLAERAARCPHCGTSFRIAGSTDCAARVSSTTPPTSGRTPTYHPDLPSHIGVFRVVEKLGEGAFGVVYKCRDESLGRDVAIKVLKEKALGSDEGKIAKYVERFLREARVVAQMPHHGNIVPVHQLDKHEGRPFIVSTFISGQSLSKMVPEAGLDARRAVRLTIQLLEALAHAHSQGVLHRDVKPSNAMLDANDTLYLVDFGLAGLVDQDDGRMTQECDVMGTPCYMPPEQAKGDLKSIGPASDQYSAGVVLYELLTGQLPFEGSIPVILFNAINTPPQKPSEFRKDLDPQLERICLKALAKRPEDRFPSCRAFADILKAWLEGKKPSPVPKAMPPAPSPGPATGRKSSAMVETTAPGKSRTLKESPPTKRSLVPPHAGSDSAHVNKMSQRRWILIVAAVLAFPIIGAAGYVSVSAFLAKKGGTTAPKSPTLGDMKEGTDKSDK